MKRDDAHEGSESTTLHRDTDACAHDADWNFRRPIHIVVQSQCHTLQIEEGQLHSIKLTREGIVDCNPEDYHEQDEADCKDWASAIL
jgi:hypothetical protein